MPAVAVILFVLMAFFAGEEMLYRRILDPVSDFPCAFDSVELYLEPKVHIQVGRECARGNGKSVWFLFGIYAAVHISG